MVAVNEDGSIADAFVLDLSWRDVLAAPFNPKGKAMVAETPEEELNRNPIPLTSSLAGQMACHKVYGLAGETKWSRTQKIEAIRWLAENADGSDWNDLCEDAKRRFKIMPIGALDEYNWFGCCLFLKQILDFIARNKERKAVVAPIAPLND